MEDERVVFIHAGSSAAVFGCPQFLATILPGRFRSPKARLVECIATSQLCQTLVFTPAKQPLSAFLILYLQLIL